MYVMIGLGVAAAGYFNDDLEGKKLQHMENVIAALIWPITIAAVTTFILANKTSKLIKEIKDGNEQSVEKDDSNG